MKHFLFLTCLLLSNFVFAQSNEQLHTIEPKWKLGDVKKVHTESLTKIFIQDSLVNHTIATADYSIKVIDTINNYTLLYSNEPNSFDIKSNSPNAEVDSIINLFTKIAEAIEKEIKSFQYEILVDKNTAQAFEVKNSDRLIKLIEEVAITMTEKLGAEAGIPNSQIENMKQNVITELKQKEQKVLETMMNEFNYIMSAYSLTFPYNSSISQKTMVYDVNALGEFGDIEMPAVITISSKKADNTLTVLTDTDYEKDFLLEQIKLKYKNMSNLTTSDIFLSEKAEASFITTTNWIISQKSHVIFKTKEVKVTNETSVSFQ